MECGNCIIIVRRPEVCGTTLCIVRVQIEGSIACHGPLTSFWPLFTQQFISLVSCWRVIWRHPDLMLTGTFWNYSTLQLGYWYLWKWSLKFNGWRLGDSLLQFSNTAFCCFSLFPFLRYCPLYFLVSAAVVELGCGYALAFSGLQRAPHIYLHPILRGYHPTTFRCTLAVRPLNHKLSQQGLFSCAVQLIQGC